MGLAENLSALQRRMEAACIRAHRPLGSVQLVAVSKNHPPEVVEEAARLGLSLFGESRVQEAKVKIPACSGRLRWHFIGHVQTNKCREMVELFDMIESVDSLRVAEEVSRRARAAAKTMPVLLQVNVAGESTKFGYAPAQALAEVSAISALPNLELNGLMTIAPYATDPERARPVFRRLRELKDSCEQVLGAPLPRLSMGMSGDFEVAIEEGATLIRVGTALFGPRTRPTGDGLDGGM